MRRAPFLAQGCVSGFSLPGFRADPGRRGRLQTSPPRCPGNLEEQLRAALRYGSLCPLLSRYLISLESQVEAG
jgi:hypothetical protein